MTNDSVRGYIVIVLKNLGYKTEEIEKVLDEESASEEKVSKLIRKCNARGGTDNISIAYLIINEGSSS